MEDGHQMLPKKEVRIYEDGLGRLCICVPLSHVFCVKLNWFRVRKELQTNSEYGVNWFGFEFPIWEVQSELKNAWSITETANHWGSISAESYSARNSSQTSLNSHSNNLWWYNELLNYIVLNTEYLREGKIMGLIGTEKLLIISFAGKKGWPGFKEQKKTKEKKIINNG